MSGSSKSQRLFIAGILAVSLAGCGDPSGVKEDIDSSGQRNKRTAQQGIGGQNREQGTLFGPGGLFGSKPDKGTETGTGIAVNAYLWRASLDTINFIPLASADPFGGVIITDWYTPVETPNERMKVQVTILDRELRADGVRVSVFKQTMAAKTGGWIDDQVDPHTNTDIENAILTRARQLRIAQGK
jgi:predicted small secreted protein